MQHTYDTIPELEDLLKKLDDQDSISNETHFLVDEVRFSNLRRMNDANLAGRLAYYEREYTFELNKRKRSEFYREVIRTKIETRRRVLERRDAAIAAALKPEPGTIEPAAVAA
jgi:predicted nucleic-acid-binding protein